FWPSSPGLAGPGSLLLRSAPATFCNAAKLPTAAAAVPIKLRRVNALMIMSPEGFEFVFVMGNRSRHALLNRYIMVFRTSASPLQTHSTHPDLGVQTTW